MSSKLLDVSVLDLYSGMGGFSLGFKEAGFQINEGLDNWKDAVTSYQTNLHEPARVMDLSNYFPARKDFDIIVIGGPPCQEFSKINLHANPYGKRAQLSLDYLRIIFDIRPAVFVFENVVTLPKWVRSALLHFPGYKVTINKLNALQFGVPQDRERLIFIGHRTKSIAVPVIDRHFLTPVTVRQVFSQLATNWGFVNHRPETIDKFSQITSGDWTNINEVDGKFKAVLRLNWDAIAPTMANVKKLQILHPSENRVISLAEALALQSFPQEYIPYGSDTSKAQQIANAVPPKMAEGIAKVIAKAIS